MGTDLGDVRVIFLNRDNPLAWALMPDAIARARQFCRKYQGDSDPDVIETMMRNNFVADEPLLLTVVGVKEAVVIGHVLASIDEWCGRRYLTIVQYEVDRRSRIPPGLLQAALQKLLAWGRRMGAVKAQSLVRSKALAKAFDHLYGFKSERILMRRGIEEG